MHVAQLMQTDVHTCRPQETLNHAAQRMWDHDCGCLPVVDEEEKPIAMLTDRDVCMAAYTQGRLLFDIPVSSAMSRRLITCRPDDSLASAEELMQKHQIRRLPVLDAGGRLAGLLSLNDIARLAARTRAEKRRPVSEAEVGETLAAICEPRAACPVPPAAQSLNTAA